MALKGIRVVELAGLAPAPFCGMILADFGAQVVRVDRVDPTMDVDCLMRGKKSIAVDLKRKEGISILKRLCERSDVFIEPFRPGVAEKLHFGPEQLMQANPKLIYARLTGFGQNGPYSGMAGHDINYCILSCLGRRNEKPTPPLHLLGDFAGGGLICALGIVIALLERSKSGKGQVIDANMVEGAAYLGSWLFKSRHLPLVWSGPRGTNLLDTGSPIYDTYETKDGRYVAIGAIEPQFQAVLFKKLDLNFDARDSFLRPEIVRKSLEEKLKTKTRNEWETIFEGSDACLTPVLEISEVAKNKHNAERKSFRRLSGITPESSEFPESAESFEPKPAPKLGRTFADPDFSRNPKIGENSEEILKELNYSKIEIEKFLADGSVLQIKQPNGTESKL